MWRLEIDLRNFCYVRAYPANAVHEVIFNRHGSLGLFNTSTVHRRWKCTKTCGSMAILLPNPQVPSWSINGKTIGNGCSHISIIKLSWILSKNSRTLFVHLWIFEYNIPSLNFQVWNIGWYRYTFEFGIWAIPMRYS